MSEQLRQCRDCGLEANSHEELSFFVKDKSYLFGRRNLCKKCHNARNNNRRANNIRALLRERIGYILQRCYNEKTTYFNHYGGRGISVHPEWIKNPETFIEWALENGFKRGLWIDRIDNDGNYTPDNCRFVTKADSNKNRSDTVTDFENLTRICRTCGKEKSLTEFHRDRTYSLGRKYVCIECSKEQHVNT